MLECWVFNEMPSAADILLSRLCNRPVNRKVIYRNQQRAARLAVVDMEQRPLFVAILSPTSLRIRLWKVLAELDKHGHAQVQEVFPERPPIAAQPQPVKAKPPAKAKQPARSDWKEVQHELRTRGGKLLARITLCDDEYRVTIFDADDEAYDSSYCAETHTVSDVKAIVAHLLQSQQQATEPG